MAGNDVVSKMILFFLCALVLAFTGCGGSGEVGGPSDGSSPAPAVMAPVAPARMVGYFVTPAGARDAASPGGVNIVLPSWGQDAGAVASSLVASNAFALVSAHHVFSNPPDTWERDWQHTKEWMAPIQSTGRLLGIYVIDEPFGGEIRVSRGNVEAAVARVQADGYRTMVAEVFHWYRAKGQWRPPVTWFGVTAYYDKFDYVEDAYRNDPNLDVVFGTTQDEEPWRELAARRGKHLFFWSWDLGAARLGGERH